jgi:hypothetical protein
MKGLVGQTSSRIPWLIVSFGEPELDRPLAALTCEGREETGAAGVIAGKIYGRSFRQASPSRMTTTSLTPVGHSADSPEPLLRPWPTTGHEANILETYEVYFGYNAERFP